MHEPNIQCIPRDFEICAESKEVLSMRTAFIASAGKVISGRCTMSMSWSFIAFESSFALLGNQLVAADYSQLELRILAYLSGDAKLRDVLNCGQDVFCNLAATWNSISSEQVCNVLAHTYQN